MMSNRGARFKIWMHVVFLASLFFFHLFQNKLLLCIQVVLKMNNISYHTGKFVIHFYRQPIVNSRPTQVGHLTLSVVSAFEENP